MGWKQCGQEIGSRLERPGLLRVFVFNISIHVGRDTMAVVLSVRVPWHVSLLRCSMPVSTVSQIGRPEDKKNSEWYQRKLRTAPTHKAGPWLLICRRNSRVGVALPGEKTRPSRRWKNPVAASAIFAHRAQSFTRV